MIKGYSLLILFLVAITLSCSKIGDVNLTYGKMKCSGAVPSTEVFSADSTVEMGFLPEVEFGYAQTGFYNKVQNVCPSDSVRIEFTCHLVGSLASDVSISINVINYLDEAPGNPVINWSTEGDLLVARGYGSFMAPSDSRETEFAADLQFFFKSSGNVLTDQATFLKFFRDYTLKFNYSKISE